MSLQQVSEQLQMLGIRRIHTFAWRDLDDPEAGGSEVHADQIFKRWADSGLEIFHRTSTADTARSFQRNGYHVIQKGGRYGVFPSAVMHELRSGRSSRDAVIEIWNGVPWFSQLWSRVPRNVWLHHIHGPMWKQSLPPGLAQLGNLLESRIAPPFYKRTPIITLANSSRDELVHLGFSPAKVHVVNPGVDESFCLDNNTQKTQFPSLIAVGRLAPVKRFDVLMHVVAKVRESVPQIQLVIVGDGPDRQHLESIIQENDYGFVRLAGRMDQHELVSAYRMSWLVVSASIAEGWGMTITEGAACGTPAVAIDNAGHRDAIMHQETGLISKDVDAMANDIVRAINSKALLSSLRIGALNRSHQLRWDNTATATLSHLLDEAKNYPA